MPSTPDVDAGMDRLGRPRRAVRIAEVGDDHADVDAGLVEGVLKPVGDRVDRRVHLAFHRVDVEHAQWVPPHTLNR